MSAAPDRIELEIVTTFDDQMAFSIHAMKRPPLSTLRRRREIVGVASAPVWLVGGILLAWAFDKDHLPLPDFIRFVLAHPALLLAGLAFAFVAMLLGVLFNRVWARRRVADLLRRTLKDRADVDAGDPKLAQRTRTIFDETGITSETSLGHGVVKWAAVKSLDETADHLFLICGPLSGFMVPKRLLDPETLERLKALIATNLDRASRPAGDPSMTQAFSRPV